MYREEHEAQAAFYLTHGRLMNRQPMTMNEMGRLNDAMNHSSNAVLLSFAVQLFELIWERKKIVRMKKNKRLRVQSAKTRKQSLERRRNRNRKKEKVKKSRRIHFKGVIVTKYKCLKKKKENIENACQGAYRYIPGGLYDRLAMGLYHLSFRNMKVNTSMEFVVAGLVAWVANIEICITFGIKYKVVRQQVFDRMQSSYGASSSGG
ncbi:hypothetical protein Ancab_011557 [Ancistrocladus abbreviatus]